MTAGEWTLVLIIISLALNLSLVVVCFVISSALKDIHKKQNQAETQMNRIEKHLVAKGGTVLVKDIGKVHLRRSDDYPKLNGDNLNQNKCSNKK